MAHLQLKPKQKQTIQILNEHPNVDEIVLVGSVGCFGAGTPVLTEGGYKPIEDISVGEFVVAYADGVAVKRRVNFASGAVNKPKPMIYLEYELSHLQEADRLTLSDKKPEVETQAGDESLLHDGVQPSRGETETIRATFDHPFYDAESKRYYPLYQFVWRDLDESQRLQLKLLCEQYGETIDYEPSMGVRHFDSQTWERPLGTSSDGDGRQDSQSPSSGSWDMDRKSKKSSRGEPHGRKPSEQPSREFGVVYEEPQQQARLRDGAPGGFSGESQTGTSSEGIGRAGSGDARLVAEKNGRSPSDRQIYPTRAIHRISSPIPLSREEDGTKCDEEAIKLSSVQVVEAEPYYAIGVDDVHTYIVGRGHLPVHNTGKSVIASHMIASICYQFPDTRWFAWRKNNSVSRRTLVRTFRKTLSQMNLIEGKDWTWHDMAMEIRFPHNGSIITFSEADRSKDRDQMKIKGIDATGNFIDEANELEEDTFDMVLSRKGRANENGQPSINVITMNPNNGWSKRRYYDKWKKGTLPSNVMVVEYTIQDSWQSENDIAALYRKAKWWVERYVKNNWNYSDEDSSLISSYLWEKSLIYEPPKYGEGEFDKVIGVDPSDVGTDTTVATLIDHGVMIEQKELEIPRLEFGLNSKTDERPISHLYGNELIKFAQKHGFTAKEANRIAVEENGIGVGLRDDLRKRGWNITAYHATGQSRTQIYLNLRASMDKGNLKILYRDEEKFDDNTLQRQLFAHQTDMRDEKEIVLPKSEVKKELGRSPDKADSLAIANWLTNGKDLQDPRYNQNRVAW